MSKIDWYGEALKRKDEFLRDTQEFLRIKSVLDEANATEQAPLGEGIQQALQFMLAKGKEDGFETKDVKHLAGHIEMGKGKEIVGILCHVDVVPEGDGWASDPFGAEIRDGKIFARGVLDDKGPTMAAYYAMKIVDDLGLPLQKRVRMILGTDEESDWRCVDTYFKEEEMPHVGFAPDADFPIIFAEKGIWDFYLEQAGNPNGTEEAIVTVDIFEAGQRFNMVPDRAKAKLTVTDGAEMIKKEYEDFLAEHKLEGSAHILGGEVHLEIIGVSAHGMEPRNGKNAGLYLARFLNNLSLPAHANSYFSFVDDYLWEGSRGDQFGVAYEDPSMGDTTMNIGLLRYNPQEGGSIGINLRYPSTYDWDGSSKAIINKAEEKGFTARNVSHSEPHHVEKDSFLVKTLSDVYEGQTGEEAELLAIGGGTYARSLKAGVAFGPLFPGREDIAHQKDEYMFIEDLLKAISLYAEAIYRLAK
ncbi:MAG: dipeptidase PepV [Bacillus sp. (in: firmicutes)]